MQNIPSVDLSDFLTDNGLRKEKIIQDIGKAYEEIGFVALRGHFLSDDLTNNKVRSTIHRVVNPPQKDWGKLRYSIPFFTHPKSIMSLNCLPICIDKKHPKLYDDITAGAYLNERLIELGLK